MTLETTLQNARKRWLEAKSKGDTKGMELWEKLGKSIKTRIEEKLALVKKEQEIENIFGGKLK